MKQRYRLFLRRKSVYCAFDNSSRTFESLKTKDKAEATRLLATMNEAGHQPAINLGLAKVYLRHSDPMIAQRTWQHVLDEIINLKCGPTQYRWQTAAKDKAFDAIRTRPLYDEPIDAPNPLDWFRANVVDHCPIYALFRADKDTD